MLRHSDDEQEYSEPTQEKCWEEKLFTPAINSIACELIKQDDEKAERLETCLKTKFKIFKGFVQPKHAWLTSPENFADWNSQLDCMKFSL